MYCLNVPPWHKPRYLHRHDGALKILFYELLWEHWLIEGVPPPYSPVMPKPAYQNATSEAFFGIFPSLQSTTKLEQIGSTRDLSAKRGKRKKHSSMGPWCGSWSRDTMVTGGYSTHLETSVRKLLGARPRGVLERRQTSVISNTLNIARTFKISRNTSVAKRIFYWCFYVDFIQFAIILGRL